MSIGVEKYIVDSHKRSIVFVIFKTSRSKAVTFEKIFNSTSFGITNVCRFNVEAFKYFFVTIIKMSSLFGLDNMPLAP
jgi:hypothetical protein